MPQLLWFHQQRPGSLFTFLQRRGCQKAIYILQECYLWVTLAESQEVIVESLIEQVGEFLNPCGSRVRVSCPENPFSGSVHSRANTGWLRGDRSSEKKASFKSGTV